MSGAQVGVEVSSTQVGVEGREAQRRVCNGGCSVITLQDVNYGTYYTIISLLRAQVQ